MFQRLSADTVPSLHAPLSPLTSVKLVLKQVILVLKVGVGIKITCVCDNKHNTMKHSVSEFELCKRGEYSAVFFDLH